jgi:hypothetical protein
MDTKQSERFLRQLLLYRYQQLLMRIESVYNPTEEQKAALTAKILHLSWIDSAWSTKNKYEDDP